MIRLRFTDDWIIVRSGSNICGYKRTRGIENIPTVQEDLSFARLARPIWLHEPEKCKQRPDSVRHVLHYILSQLLSLQDRRKPVSLHLIFILVHLAVGTGGCYCAVFKVITADCEGVRLTYEAIVDR